MHNLIFTIFYCAFIGFVNSLTSKVEKDHYGNLFNSRLTHSWPVHAHKAEVEVEIEGHFEMKKSNEFNGGLGVDSDYLSLYLNPTTLPIEGGHNGVFAKHEIKIGSLICEYRGPVVKKSLATNNLIHNNYTWDLDVNGEPNIIIGNSLCAIINDCVNILNNSRILNREYLNYWHTATTTHGSSLEVPEEIACTDGRTHNVVSIMSGQKVFYVAARDIMPGEELFVYYGNSYCKCFSPFISLHILFLFFYFDTCNLLQILST
jgi:hypothetical protein